MYSPFMWPVIIIIIIIWSSLNVPGYKIVLHWFLLCQNIVPKMNPEMWNFVEVE